MPETMFKVRWPDGALETCYSPSSVVRDYFEVDRSYALADFVALCRQALTAASDRVRARYGGAGCAHAMAQLAAIEAKAGQVSTPDAEIRIEGFVC